MAARILIADADPDLIKIYREHLEELGLAVRTTTDGVECANLLREFRPNLLLLGTSLPWGGCDGVLALIMEEPELRPEFVLNRCSGRRRLPSIARGNWVRISCWRSSAR